MKITMAHGSGGAMTGELIHSIFARWFENPILGQMEDSAVVPGHSRLAVTTDSFVVDPLVFPGGDIGRLSVCGTVNDLLMRGADPQYLTCGFILQEGLDTDLLDRIVQSMAAAAKEAGVAIIAGDTKVTQGNGGLYINTAGVGFVPEGREIASPNSRPGDAILLSGTLGDHHAAILSHRMGIRNSIVSDCAPLHGMVRALLAHEIPVHTMRDVTRGGLATVCKELAEGCGKTFLLEEEKLPITPAVRDLCAILGLDPLYMGNEGKMVLTLPGEYVPQALSCLRTSPYGENACCIGWVIEGEPGTLLEETAIGGRRRLDVLQGEGLPRIC